MADIVVDSLITELDYEANVGTIDKANKAVGELEKSNLAAAKATDELTEQQTDLASELADTAKELDGYKKRQRALKATIKETGKATAEQKGRLTALGNQIERTQQRTTKLRQQQKQLGIQKQRVSLEARKLTRDQNRLAKATQKAAEKMRAEADAAQESGGALGSLAERIQGVAGGELAAEAVTKIAGGVFELGREVITTGANFEALRARLKTVEGSAKGASKAFALIQDFTSTTPFQLEEVTTAFVRLKSLGLDASQESLQAFGNLSAAQGKSIIEFIEAVADASTGEFERLKEFGIKASSQGDKVAFTFKGQTTTVGKNAKEIQEFLKGLGQTEFAGAMEDQMATLNGAFSNFQDTVAQAADGVAQLGVLDEVKLLVKDLSTAIGGGGGLAQLIADVLVTALRTARELFAALPKDELVEFFQSVVRVVKLVASQFVGAASDGSDFAGTLLELVASLINAAAAVGEVFAKVDEFGDKLPEVPGLLDLIVLALNLSVKAMKLLADAVTQLTELLSPLLDELSSMADLIPSFNLFDGATDKVKGFAVSVGLLNSELAQTGNVASAAIASMQELFNVQAVQRKKEEGFLSKAADKVGAPGKAKLDRQRMRNEKISKQAAARAAEGGALIRKRRSDVDRQLGNPKKLSRNDLDALARDPDLSSEQRQKASKILNKRKGKKGKSEGLLTETVDKEIKKLAKAAGERASARALLAGATAKEADASERAKRKSTKKRLTRRFEETGQLPPGLASDLTQTASIPNIEATGGRLAPPVITVNTTNINVTGNTFEANVSVKQPNASAAEIAHTVAREAGPVTFRDLGNAIRNNTTKERR